MKKVIFYLMNEKGFYTLSRFINKFSSNNIKYVVASGDKNMKKDYFKEIMLLCEGNNILFFTRSTEPTEKCNEYKFAIGWRWIIKNDNNLIVFHDSKLPKYRGFSPLVNSLISGNKQIGVTALFANSEYDEGDIILQQCIKITYPIKISKAINQIKPLYYKIVRDLYELILKDNKIYSKKQNKYEVSYSMWLDKEDYFIDWKNWSAKKIKRFVDAVGYPFDNAKSYLNNNIIQLIDVEIVKNVKINHRLRHIGKVIFKIDGIPIIVCKKGLLKLVDIRNNENENIQINFRSRFF